MNHVSINIIQLHGSLFLTINTYVTTTVILYINFSLDATGNLTSIPEASIPGRLSVCPGVSFSLTCVHNNPNPDFAATFWQLPGVSQCIVSHSVSGDVSCDTFTITMISGTTGPTLNSTVSVTAIDSLSGEVFGCLDGINPTSPSVGNIALDVLSELLDASAIVMYPVLMDWVALMAP